MKVSDKSLSCDGQTRMPKKWQQPPADMQQNAIIPHCLFELCSYDPDDPLHERRCFCSSEGGADFDHFTSCATPQALENQLALETLSVLQSRFCGSGAEGGSTTLPSIEVSVPIYGNSSLLSYIAYHLGLT